MHERVNQWLSPELIAAANARSASRRPSRASTPSPSYTRPTTAQPVDELARALNRDRRSWLRRLSLQVLAFSLLCGSAAFSYVAWSDALPVGSLALKLPSMPTRQMVSPQVRPSDPMRARALQPQGAGATEEIPVTPVSEEIRTLRETNVQLRERLAALQATLSETAELAVP